MRDSLQVMHVNGATEQRFHHYCYICNTQLNSCKQALLHCNGKRHKKKLYYLQQRRGIGSIPPSTASPVVAAAAGPSHNSAVAPDTSSPVPAILYPPSAGSYTGYPMTPSPGFCTTPTVANPEGRLFTSQTIASNNGTVIYPILIGSPMMPEVYPPSGHPSASPPFACAAPPPVPVNYPPPPLPPISYVYEESPTKPLGTHRSLCDNSTCSSPLFLTELSYSSAEPASSHSNRTGSRSTIISPSGTSSASSTDGKPRCDICLATFATPAQLFAHLRAAKHFRPLTLDRGSARTGAIIPVNEVQSRRPLVDSSNMCVGPSSGFLYCSVCHIASNSEPGCSVSDVRSGSPSSSDSTQEGPTDSGYLSGASNAEVVRVNSDQSNIAKFHCQLCDVFLNSPLQAKQHISSPRHQCRETKKQPSIRRKVMDRLKRKTGSTVPEPESTTVPVNEP